MPLVSSDEPVDRYLILLATPGAPPKLNVRTVRLRLLPSSAQERSLRKLADATAKLWDELNYARIICM